MRMPVDINGVKFMCRNRHIQKGLTSTMIKRKTSITITATTITTTTATITTTIKTLKGLL